jgi:hypothetical protein
MIQRVSAPVRKAQQASPASSQPSPSPGQEPLLRRKFACGGGVGSSDDGGEYRPKQLQRKRAASSWPRSHHSLAPPIVHEVLHTPGRPLDSGVRAFMEPRFDYDFSRVRVHAGPLAAESAEAVGAQAYTVGQDVVFNDGKYTPSTTEGKKLLAHELSHVVQQAGASSGRELKIGSENDASEREAEKTADHVVNRGANDSPLRAMAPAPVRLARQNQDPADAGVPADGGNSSSTELTDDDAAKCTPLYLQKLCIYIVGGFNGDRSGVPDDQEWANLNKGCRDESGYDGPDVQLSDNEKNMLKNPTCKRGSPKERADKARNDRIADALQRSSKYGNFGEDVVKVLKDPIFQASVAVAIGGYLLLWVVPEPVVTKLAAALTTIAVLSAGAFSISTIYNLAKAWTDLETEAGSATSDDQIEAAAKKFGERITQTEANLLVYLGTLLISSALPTPKGLPPSEPALSNAKGSLSQAPEGGVVIRGPWGRGRAVSTTGELSPPAIQGNNALKIEAEPLPEIEPQPVPANDNVVPLPKPQPAPTPGNQPTPTPVAPVVPNPNTPDKKPKPPFVLYLPQVKAPHLTTYRHWLSTLQSDPNYDRGNPHQDRIWHDTLSTDGSDPIPPSVYERGHQLGLTGEAGEKLIRVPDWTRTSSVEMEVDHIVELQVTPMAMRAEFNSIFNMELLDQPSNGSSGPRLDSNIKKERAKQEAADPTLVGKIIKFDAVQMDDDGGTGERWTLDEIKAGKQLDAYKKT